MAEQEVVTGQADDRAIADQQVADAAQLGIEDQGQASQDGGGADHETDFSKIDPNDPDQLANLSDADLAGLEKYNREHPTPEPGTATTDTPDASTDGAAAPAADAATKYAGKYASTDDLVNGVSEITKKLGVDATAIIEAAKASGEFKTLEALYKSYEKTLSEKGAASPASPASPSTPAPATDTAAGSFNPADPQVNQAVDQLTISQLAQSVLAQRMAAKGLSIPKNMEEFDQLADINPFFAGEFKQAYQELFRSNLDEAKGFFEAARTFETSNASIVDTDTQAIKALAKEQGFKITDAEIAAVKTAALANAFNYETKHGHKFLRTNAVRDQFLTNSLPGKLKEIALNHQINGRQQAVADMGKAAKKEMGGLGAAKVGSRTRAIPKMPDLNDPDVVAGLPDEALADPEGYFRKQGFR